ncbi:MAG: RluA family pseudouridine synthase [Candidatus Omnitrophota bacterium]
MKKAFSIIFDDQYLIVVNKIAKVLIQPSPKGEKTTLTSILQRELGQKVFPCHRLDRETSGLIIYAKSLKVQQKIIEQFRRRKVKKKYIAFIKGNLGNKKGIWEGEIIDREGRIFGEKAKVAKTIYRVLKDFVGWSLVEFIPITGRTNQLRIQAAKVNHPILGESKYAFRRDFSSIGAFSAKGGPASGWGVKVKFRRLALHAFYLRFTHPVSRKTVSLEIDLASDMKEWYNLKKAEKDAKKNILP